MNTSEKKFRWHEATAWRVLEGQAFVVSLDRSRLHKLNSVGTRVWELLGEGRTAGEVARALTREFAVDLETAEEDTKEFVKELLAQGVIERRD